MLQYMFCVSRFAHYVKVIGRDKVGSFAGPQDLEKYIHQWIHKYVTPDTEARPDVKARRPLREAKVSVSEIRGKPGSFKCTMHLAPHYELDEINASVTLKTVLTPGTNS
jgi:type VI secretion system protein ImpD